MTIVRLFWYLLILINYNIQYSFADCEIDNCYVESQLRIIDNTDSCSPCTSGKRKGEFDDCFKEYEDDLAITTDARIKTNIYNPNEVYLIVLHYGFQSNIEFGPGEEVETISLGDTFGWQITTLGRRLIIRPLEKSIKTNMTVITNKRTYQFDIVSKDTEQGYEKDLVYVTRFYYPKKKCR